MLYSFFSLASHFAFPSHWFSLIFFPGFCTIFIRGCSFWPSFAFFQFLLFLLIAVECLALQYFYIQSIHHLFLFFSGEWIEDAVVLDLLRNGFFFMFGVLWWWLLSYRLTWGIEVRIVLSNVLIIVLFLHLSCSRPFSHFVYSLWYSVSDSFLFIRVVRAISAARIEGSSSVCSLLNIRWRHSFGDVYRVMMSTLLVRLDILRNSFKLLLWLMLVRSMWTNKQYFSFLVFRFLKFAGSINRCMRSTVDRFSLWFGSQSNCFSTFKLKGSCGFWLNFRINWLLPVPDAPAITITCRARFPLVFCLIVPFV